ncbi:MAG: signal peptidase II [Bacteriovoracaceae bacterium]|nr:signal peptidase II [Bacteriovoracaceae bacterium]
MRRFLELTIIFIAVLSFDQVSKVGASMVNGVVFGPIEFGYLINKGLSFSLISGLSAYLRVVAVSTAFGLLLIVASFLLYLAPKKLKTFKLGIVVWAAGITGNVIDRIIYGGVIDFISIRNNWFFNFADIAQLFGFAFVIFSIFKYEKTLWFPSSLRSLLSVKSIDQWVLITKIFISTILVGATLGIFSITYIYHGLRVFSRDELIAYCVLFFLLVFLLAFLLTFFTFVFSQRVTGPILAFERYVGELTKGHNKEFKLRDGDHHQSLIDIANRLREHLYENEKT